LAREDFVHELSFYKNVTYRKCLPRFDQAFDNADGRLQSRSGYCFPPFIALDRGITLEDWLECDRNASSILAMAVEIVELLAQLHAAGSVHRDLKPQNVLFVLSDQKWRLLDFGIAQKTGPRPSFERQIQPCISCSLLGLALLGPAFKHVPSSSLNGLVNLSSYCQCVKEAS
jgi:serine/threonine protein kinase